MLWQDAATLLYHLLSFVAVQVPSSLSQWQRRSSGSSRFVGQAINSRAASHHA